MTNLFNDFNGDLNKVSDILEFLEMKGIINVSVWMDYEDKRCEELEKRIKELES